MSGSVSVLRWSLLREALVPSGMRCRESRPSRRSLNKISDLPQSVLAENPVSLAFRTRQGMPGPLEHNDLDVRLIQSVQSLSALFRGNIRVLRAIQDQDRLRRCPPIGNWIEISNRIPE